MDTDIKKRNNALKCIMGGIFIAMVTFLLVGTIAYHALEEWTWIQSLYFSAATLTTVGYGDLAPSHNASMIFSTFYMLLGVATFLSFVSVLSVSIAEHFLKKENQ